MPKLITEIDEHTWRVLERRARQNRRTVEAEVAEILRHAVREEREAIIQRLQQLHARLGGRCFSSSVELIREDRI
ncbi:MAG: hypothetical protein ABDI19_06975 [Armatimonadota bacterium]